MESYTTPKKSSWTRFFADLKIGPKLGIGFGFLILLIFFNAVVSYRSSSTATEQITSTNQVRVPTALIASRAQANLLRMLADVRGYLALGDTLYRDGYKRSSALFEKDLEQLKKKPLGPDDEALLVDLEQAYNEWKSLPEQLFELRDDQLDREPAYRKLATDGVAAAGQVIINVNQLIDQQKLNTPTLENQAMMADTTKFQGNFLAMLSALRGYTTTRNRIYRGEYEVNLSDNQNVWLRLLNQKSKIPPAQQKLLNQIYVNRYNFLRMPDEIFGVLESDQWRSDLYLFTTKAVPLADRMSKSLDDLVFSQQTKLTSELDNGRSALNTANQLILTSGLIALVFGLAMGLASRNLIAQPIIRLTAIAEQIRSGDLEAQAKVESRDEIGLLASTFNNMTSQLRQTLVQVRKEKKRADDLLDVVIPIGVDLTTEKDFNRLLEKMLMEAKNFCRADTGVLYMNSQGKDMEFVIVRSDSLNLAFGGTTGNRPIYKAIPLQLASGEPNNKNVITAATLKGETLNFTNASEVKKFDLWGDGEKNVLLNIYEVHSMLTIPLKNSEDKVLGILQLINPRDADTGRIIPFDSNLQRMMESFSSLAIAALEAYTREFKLKQEIQQLRIEIDEAKQKQQVKEIVDTDFFQNLTIRARDLRQRRSNNAGGNEPGNEPAESSS